MNEAIKEIIRSFFRKAGIEIIGSKHWPFGIDWLRDIKYFKNSAEISVAFDVGANIGNKSLMISKIFPESVVFCFEPVPSTYNELLERTKKNSRIRPVQLALGDIIHRGLITNKPLSGQNTMLLDSREEETVEVAVDTISHFCTDNKIEKIGLLKIDTEGYDLTVLKGAEDLLRQHLIDFIVLECDFLKRKEEPHEGFMNVFEYLKNYDFNVVSFYTCGVDDLGWVWGDVLFRNILNSKGGRISGSPAVSLINQSHG